MTITPRVTYSYHRLCFLKSEIDPLGSDDYFRIITPIGTFQMTKAEFYSTFANVAESKSYLIDGIYHYPVVPSKALKYRITRC